jgi:saccharopine dehydrogenase-like NADP-dependent oxidoreductase
VAGYLNSSKIGLRRVDLGERENLVSALAGSDACLNATVYYSNLDVMQACLEARVHYIDLGGLFHTTRRQLELDSRFAEAGLSAVLGMGSAPGIPNVQARYAADRLETIESIRIYDGIRPPADGVPLFTYAIPTILDEMTLEPMVFTGGAFAARPPMSGLEQYWFTSPLGLLPVNLSLHSEVATLPLSFREKGIQECFFKINAWGLSPSLVETVRAMAELGFASREPIQAGGQAVVPRQVLVALLSKYVPPINAYLAPPQNRPPDWVKEIVTEVRGTTEGRQVTYRLGTLTCKSALPTGVAPAVAAVWLAERRVRPGVHPPEAVLEPEPFFQELERKDIPTQVSITSWL